MSTRLIVPLALLIALVLGGVWFLSHFERVPGKERVPASGEARLRDFLAAERLAQRMGMPARELRALGELDRLPPRAVLLLPSHRQSVDRPHIARLLAWVRRGGHLVAEAELPGVDDPLLEALGIERERLAEAPQPGPVSVQVGERRLRAILPGRIVLKTPVSSHIDAGGRLISFHRGIGVATVATRLDFARNDFIGREDDAELFWRIAELTPASSLQVLLRPERLSLWKFLAEHAAPALIAGFALLALWLWRIAPRFGPVAPDAPPARRRLLDHLRASGRYLWTQGLRGPLAAAARDAALRRLARAQPDFALAPPAEQARRVAALAGISTEEATRFMSAGSALRGADFMRLAAIAQRVHATIERGSR